MSDDDVRKSLRDDFEYAHRFQHKGFTQYDILPNGNYKNEFLQRDWLYTQAINNKFLEKYAALEKDAQVLAKGNAELFTEIEKAQAAHASQQARIDALEAKLAEVSKDSERLDLLMNGKYILITDVSKTPATYQVCNQDGLILFGGFLTYREAIDEAIKKDKS